MVRLRVAPVSEHCDSGLEEALSCDIFVDSKSVTHGLYSYLK